MRLSTRVRYGLRALLAIKRHDGETMTSEAIARQEGISKKYLDEILAMLRRDGLVATRRGAHGGYGLARTPADITLLSLVETLDGPVALAPCMGEVDCTRVQQCATRPVWLLLNQRMRELLRGITLAEVAELDHCDGCGDELPGGCPAVAGEDPLTH